MKRLMIAVGAILLACLALWGASLKLTESSVASGGKRLIIYNWGDYINPALIKKFEKRTGYQVIYQTFDSNEAMYTKINQGGTAYDLTIPSDYMVTKMRRGKLLRPLDLERIPNRKYLGYDFLHKSFDVKNAYSLPYFWGTLGIVYNDRLVRRGSIKTWDDLWQRRFRHNILLVDSARDMMGMSLASMHHSMNTTNALQLHLAKAKLDQLGPNIKAIISDELKMYMIQNEAAVGVTWSGEAAEMLSNNRHLHYVLPEPYSNLWFDNFVIPKTAKNPAGAYAFINFMLNPKNAAQNAAYVGYASPVQAAWQYLPQAVRRDRSFYPTQKMVKKLMVFKDLPPQMVQKYNDLFLDFKMYAR